MMQRSKGQNAVHACMLRLLTFRMFDGAECSVNVRLASAEAERRRRSCENGGSYDRFGSIFNYCRFCLHLH